MHCLSITNENVLSMTKLRSVLNLSDDLTYLHTKINIYKGIFEIIKPLTFSLPTFTNTRHLNC